MNKQIVLKDIKHDPKLRSYMQLGNDNLGAMGFTEHGERHSGVVSSLSKRLLTELGYDERMAELGAIAGYLHDIGNVVSRHNHGQTGSMIAMRALEDLGMEFDEIGIIAAAIGNHEEEYGQSVNTVAAAIILADKSDVHRSRVRNREQATFDIHDRVNFAAMKSDVLIDPKARIVTLQLIIDTSISPVMDYFEIFLTRMIMCRRAAEKLNSNFSIYINEAKLL